MSDSTVDANEIRAVIDSYAALRKSGDVDGIVSLFTAEGSVMPPGAPTFAGHEQLAAAYAPYRTALGQDCFYEYDEILIDGNLAAARTRSTGTVLDRDTGQYNPGAWRELFVLSRIDGQWKIAQYMFQSA